MLPFLFVSFAKADQKCSFLKERLSSLSIDLISYKVKNEKGKILILPPTGGSSYLEKRSAKRLCKIGFSSIIIQKWKGMDKESLSLDIHSKLLSQAQKVVSVVIEEKTNPGEFVGILGTSVGAIHAITALGRFDQIKAGFFVLGGLPIHKVIAYSQEKTLKKYRKLRMKKFGFKTIEDYALALNKKIPNEVRPLFLSHKAKKKDVFTVIALRDKKVSTDYQKEMKKTLQSKSLEIPSGHFLSIIRFYLFHLKEMTGFFETSYKKFGN